MKKMKQFVFYGPNSPKNFPKDNDSTDINYMNPWKYNLFINYNSVSHLGIQGAPDVLFCLNHSGDQDAISIGGTGIYELNLEGIGIISGLRFIWDKLIEKYPGTSEDDRKKLIIDFIYEGED